MNKEDIKVEVRDGQLVIRGEKKQEKKEDKDNYIRVERSYGSFVRKITLPEGVDPQQGKATYNNGVLELRIPKSEKPPGHTLTIE